MSLIYIRGLTYVQGTKNLFDFKFTHPPPNIVIRRKD